MISSFPHNSLQRNTHVAVKVLTAYSSQDHARLNELGILQRISKADPTHPGYSHVVQILDNFRLNGPHGEHLCLVFEVLGTNIGAIRDRFDRNSLPISLTKQVSTQLLLALEYLHDCCGVIHCGKGGVGGVNTLDIQPSNILVELNDPDSLKSIFSYRPVPSCEGQYSVLQSQPVVETIEPNQIITVKIVDLGVGILSSVR
jgi:serine/threonine-protein kinase SRPK3